jgi:hypothetical protein
MNTTPRLAVILAADVVGYTSGPRASLTLSLRLLRGCQTVAFENCN